MQVDYAIGFVSDMSKFVAFYKDIVGLPLKFESPQWTEFATDGATLALHSSDEPRSADDGHQLEALGSCRSGLNVPNLDNFHARMVANDVPCIQEPEELFAVRLAQYADPDGLAFTVVEPRGGS